MDTRLGNLGWATSAEWLPYHHLRGTPEGAKTQISCTRQSYRGANVEELLNENVQVKPSMLESMFSKTPVI